MKADAKSLRFLGEGKKLTVPFFQRQYVWGTENWEELLQSFLNTGVLPFLGSIILKGPEEDALIIDGQQRLTTITLLVKALYDSLSADGVKEYDGIERNIQSFLFYKKK